MGWTLSWAQEVVPGWSLGAPIEIASSPSLTLGMGQSSTSPSPPVEASLNGQRESGGKYPA